MTPVSAAAVTATTMATSTGRAAVASAAMVAVPGRVNAEEVATSDVAIAVTDPASNVATVEARVVPGKG